jgi:putative alpha-1,2-mannosidase
VFDCPNILESYFPWDKRYVEDNGQVYAYYVSQDIPGLIALNGGNASFINRLEGTQSGAC